MIEIDKLEALLNSVERLLMHIEHRVPPEVQHVQHLKIQVAEFRELMLPYPSSKAREGGVR